MTAVVNTQSIRNNIRLFIVTCAPPLRLLAALAMFETGWFDEWGFHVPVVCRGIALVCYPRLCSHAIPKVIIIRNFQVRRTILQAVSVARQIST